MDTKLQGDVRLSRETLYERVWSEPMQRLASRFRISDVGLAKLCRRHRIPVPGRGYWAKVQAGHHPRRRPLPAAKGEEVEIVIRPTPKIVPPNEVAELDDIERLPENRITVSDELTGPHPRIVQAQRSLRNAPRDERGVLQPRAKRCVAIHVTKESLDRALRIMDALVEALEARGRTLLIESTSTTMTVVDDERLEFVLEEIVRQVQHKMTPAEQLEERIKGYRAYSVPRYDWLATGFLQLRITNLEASGVRRSWSDGKRQRLESCLNSFMSGLTLAARANRDERARRAERERRWEEERQLEAERQHRRYLEQRRIRALDEQIERWRRAGQIREYARKVAEDEDATVRTDEVCTTREEWFRWAVEYADRIDPFVGDEAERSTPGVPSLW